MEMACIIPLNAQFSDVPFLCDLLCLLLSELNTCCTEECHGITKRMERQTVVSVLVFDAPGSVTKVADPVEKTFFKLSLKHAVVLKVHRTTELCEPLKVA